MPPLRISKRKKKTTSNMTMEETLESNRNALIKDIQSWRLADYFIVIDSSHWQYPEETFLKVFTIYLYLSNLEANGFLFLQNIPVSFGTYLDFVLSRFDGQLFVRDLERSVEVRQHQSQEQTQIRYTFDQ